MYHIISYHTIFRRPWSAPRGCRRPRRRGWSGTSCTLRSRPTSNYNYNCNYVCVYVYVYVYAFAYAYVYVYNYRYNYNYNHSYSYHYVYNRPLRTRRRARWCSPPLRRSYRFKCCLKHGLKKCL